MKNNPNIDALVKANVLAQVAAFDSMNMGDIRSEVERRIKSAYRMMAAWNQGTRPHKRKHMQGRHRRTIYQSSFDDIGGSSETLHATKGWYGGKKRSRRSNRT